MKILLGRKEVNPDGPDNNGRTLLLHAAFRGKEEVAKILLGLEEVNPTSQIIAVKPRSPVPLSGAMRKS